MTIHKTTFVNMLYSREFLYDEQYQPKTRAKLVCIGEEQRIIGLHMIGLAVDEILQGFGVAMKVTAFTLEVFGCRIPFPGARVCVHLSGC